jgi:integrase/recombinase XerD
MNISDHVEKLRYFMEFRKYSKESIKNYCSCLTSFFVYFEKQGVFHPDRINSDMIIEFLKQFKKSNTHSGYHSAIKLYYSKVARVGIEKFKFIERPKKEQRLPIIIDNLDIQKLFDVCENVKHRAIMSVLYATGIRINELLTIKLSDIESKSENKAIRIIGKGNKERLVQLTDELLDILKKYYTQYKPKHWLFENDSTHKQYTARSVQEFLRQLKEKANIKAEVTPHKFRHSHATSLLEHGTDLRIIQKALGHSSSKTTEIYTHVSRSLISKLHSPLNQIKL